MFNQKQLVKIGEISRRSGLPVSTIRYYISLGLLEESYRTPGSVRMFDRKETMKRIKEISKASSRKTLKEVAAVVA